VTGSRSEVDDEGVRAALHRLDAELFRRVADKRDPVLDRVLPALSRAADFSLLWLGIAGVLALSGRRRAALRGVGSVALASATTNVAVKLQYRRVRPPLHAVPVARRVRRVPVTTSFPSGHSASAAAFATAVGLEVPGLAVPVGLLAAGVAWSRVWTGAHYPGDVAVGAAIGILAALSTGPATHRRRPGGRPSLPWHR